MKVIKIYLWLLLVCLLVSPSVAETTTIDFTGGTVYLRNGITNTTNTMTNFSNVDYYQESGFKFDYIDLNPNFSTTSNYVGYYYGGQGYNDVLHGHFGSTSDRMTSIMVTQVEGNSFNLIDFYVTTNNHVSTGGIVFINSLADDGSIVYSLQLPASEWGTNDGVVHVVLGTEFQNIKAFSFTSVGSTAFCFGVDNFNFEVLSSNTVPAPGAVLLSGIGVSLVGLIRRRL